MSLSCRLETVFARRAAPELPALGDVLVVAVEFWDSTRGDGES